MIYNYFLSLTGSAIASAFICVLFPLTYILVFVLYAVYGERKVSAFMQDRVGPNRTGYRGLLQTVADLLKMLQKEDIIPRDADKPFFILAPIIVFTGTFTAFAVIPFSTAFVGSAYSLGLLVVMAASSISAVGLLMAGWASNNKYSLLGSLRSVAQIVSYEIPTFLVVLVVVLILGTLDLTVISDKQTSYFWNWMILGGPGLSWQKFVYIPFMISSFIIIYISTLAEVNRTPFDIPEAESELVSGYHTEFTGMKFGMFFLAEYGNMFAVSFIVSILFFGGYQSPFGYLGNLFGAAWLVPIEQFIWFSAKGIFFVFVQMWLRWTLPRIRVDQLMAVCWKYLIPIAFVNLIIIGLLTVL